MRRPYGWLSLVLLVLGVAVAASGVVFLESSSKADVNAELGKWLLTVAAGLVITGALSAVVKDIDQRRTEREAWHALLNDLVAANQTFALARLRLVARQSAKSYQEQLDEFMRARVELRRIKATRIVIGEPPLHECISAMVDYLDALGREYEARYLPVARQQRLDELWLSDQMKAANTGDGAPALPELLEKPTEAWRQLQNRARFPRLARLLCQDFRIDVFRANYKLAKGRLEMHAGFRDRPIDAAIKSADKLLTRTREFMSTHRGIPAELQTSIEARAADLEQAWKKRDLGAIDATTIRLNEATAKAINAIYIEADHNAAPQHELPDSPERNRRERATGPS